MTSAERSGDGGERSGRPDFDLADHLRTRGVADDIVDAAVAAGPFELRRVAHAVVLLGGPPTLTPPDVWERTGASEELARELWRAMGFAQVPDDAVALTEADATALSTITAYLDVAGVGHATAVRFTRLLGQTMGRVADALLSIVDQGIPDMDLLPDGDGEDLIVLASDLLDPLIEQELVYLLRRHLYAGAMRRLSAGEGAHEVATVGFADVVSFTRLSGQLDERDLADLLETFEATTSDAIAEHGGRVVKLIGDAVMFRIADVAAAADLALELVERFGGDQPDLRVGLAHGQVIHRLGDVFGPTVNLASRLVSFARPGTVLVDDAFAGAVDASPGVHTKSLRPRDMKGLGTTSLHVLRRDDR